MSKLMTRFLVGVLVTLLGSLAVAPALAQTTNTSGGCDTVDAFSATGTPASVTGVTLLEDEKVLFNVSGTGDAAELAVSGDATATVTVSALPGTLAYTIPADGTYSFEVTVTNGDAGTTIEGNCLPAEEDDDDDGQVTICHRPPGNPDAAHTITVGAPAVDAHLGHGDTRGACPDGIETKYEDFELGIVIFVIYQENSIQIFDSCSEDNCDTVVNVSLGDIINIGELTIEVEGTEEYSEIDDSEEYEYEVESDDDDDNRSVSLYYLHPNPEDATVGVFQLNIYENDTLVSDNLLIFVDTEGNIVYWTDQGYWERQLEDEDDD